jgi:hypothetical protein
MHIGQCCTLQLLLIIPGATIVSLTVFAPRASSGTILELCSFRNSNFKKHKLDSAQNVPFFAGTKAHWTVLFHAVPCFFMPFHAVPCCSMQFHAVPCSMKMLESCFSCFFMQFHVRVMFFMLFHAVPCSFSCCFMQFCAVPCSFMLFHATCQNHAWETAAESKHAVRMTGPLLKAWPAVPNSLKISNLIMDRFCLLKLLRSLLNMSTYYITLFQIRKRKFCRSCAFM